MTRDCHVAFPLHGCDTRVGDQEFGNARFHDIGDKRIC